MMWLWIGLGVLCGVAGILGIILCMHSSELSARERRIWSWATRRERLAEAARRAKVDEDKSAFLATYRSEGIAIVRPRGRGR